MFKGTKSKGWKFDDVRTPDQTRRLDKIQCMTSHFINLEHARHITSLQRGDIRLGVKTDFHVKGVADISRVCST